jgi:NTP pyrophosphatase (non-canonical NTP hydrolase)
MDNPRDDQITVAQLRQLVRAFVEARDWRQFHTPKNLSMSLAIEAAELMEHFQWLTPEESRDVAANSARLSDVADELADVVCYALALANELNLDLAAAVHAKMFKNEHKYPADEYRGRYGPDAPPV